MNADADPDRAKARAIIEEAIRRAVWDATKGPAWLRDGRYEPQAPSQA